MSFRSDDDNDTAMIIGETRQPQQPCTCDNTGLDSCSRYRGHYTVGTDVDGVTYIRSNPTYSVCGYVPYGRTRHHSLPEDLVDLIAEKQSNALTDMLKEDPSLIGIMTGEVGMTSDDFGSKMKPVRELLDNVGRTTLQEHGYSCDTIRSLFGPDFHVYITSEYLTPEAGAVFTKTAKDKTIDEVNDMINHDEELADPNYKMQLEACVHSVFQSNFGFRPLETTRDEHETKISQTSLNLVESARKLVKENSGVWTFASYASVPVKLTDDTVLKGDRIDESDLDHEGIERLVPKRFNEATHLITTATQDRTLSKAYLCTSVG